MMRSTLATLTKHTMGLVLRRTSTKQRSITLIVRNFRHNRRGREKKESSSGKSFCKRRTLEPSWLRQRALIQILQQALPFRLALALAAQEGQQVARTVALNAIANQHMYPFAPLRTPHPQAYPVQKQVTHTRRSAWLGETLLPPGP